MSWGRATMLKWLSRRGWEVTAEWPSGRVRLQWYKGRLYDAKNLKTAFETIHAWWAKHDLDRLLEPHRIPKGQV